ncbi:S41 family peptidase [Phycisphaeraceae bacterium D3-23]
MPRPTLFALSMTAALAACSTGSSPANGKLAKQDHPLADQPVALPNAKPAGSVDLPRHPAISPDGQTVTFSWRGDLWRVPAQGGTAQRLTAHPGNDSTSVWSPDGTQIAFNSDRSGYGNVHLMDADGGNVTQITHEDHFLWLHDWSPAGEGDRLTVAGYVEGDVHRAPRPYSVSIHGGPIARLHDAFGRQSAVSPDGKHVVFVRGGSSWNRPFIVNSDNRDLWVYDTDAGTFTQLTDNLGNDGRPKWIDNDTVAYLSARPPARVNLYRIDLGQDDDNATALTAFSDDDVRGFDVARDGSMAVVQVWDTLYTVDLTQPGAQPAAVTINAPADLDDTVAVEALAGESDEAALSPDGKVMATTIHGDLFIRTVDSEDPPQRITNTAAREMTPVWSPDGVSLYFVSDTDGTLSIYQANVTLTREAVEAALKPAEVEEEAEETEEAEENETAEDAEDAEQGAEDATDASHAAEGEEENADEADTDEQGDDEDAEEEAEEDAGPDPADWHGALRFEITPVVQTAHHDSDPSPAPDGTTLAFRRGNGDVYLLDLATGEERLFLESWDTGMHWSWSPDSTHLALSYEDQDHNADIWVGPADGSAELVNITKHPAGDYLPSWSADGRILAFTSFRNDDQGDVFAVYLDEDLETYTAQQLSDYYEEAGNAAKKLEPLGTGRLSDQSEEVEPDEPAFTLALDDAYLRLRRLTRSSGTEWNVRILPSGGQVAYTRGSTAYVVGWDGSGEKQVAEGVDPQHLSLTGNALVALRRGTPATLAIPGGSATDVSFPGTIRVDRHAANRQRFIEASRAISMQFYDPTYKGMDWDAITQKYTRLAERAWTPDEFNDIANQYLGLLDASHMGIRTPAPANPVRQANGYLGARYERTDAGFEIVEIYDQTPAAEGLMRLHVGDVITHIDFEPLEASDTVNARLVGRVNRETAITVLRSPEHLPARPGHFSDQEDPAENEENPDNPPENQDPNAPREVILLITPISHGQLENLRYDNWQLNNKALVNEWSDGQLGYIHIRSMGAASLADFERDLYAACEGKLGMVVDVRDNGGGWTTDRLLASIMTRRHAYTVPRGADPTRTNSYPNDRLFIARYNLPMNALCNEKSFSNAEIFSHAFKTLERGTLVGNTTAGGVISTGSYSLLDGTTVRIPFRGWYLTDGTDMENNGAEPDLMVIQTPEHEAANEDPQLQAAVEDLLGRIGE